ncbi:12570_t:CDS:2, partial [Cetraspora pellucida]
LLKNEPNESEFKSKFKFRMLNVNKKSNENDYTDLDLKYDDSLSSRKLSCVSTSETLEFTKEQTKLIKGNRLSWSIAVSDKLFGLKSYKSTVRLLAISCINSHDMTLKKFIEGPEIPGFTIVYSINKDYSIEKEVLIQFNYGGVIKLFSKYENNKKTDINDQNMDIKNTNEDQNANIKKNDDDNQNMDNKETDNQNMDKYFLIILNVSGIYKYHFVHLNRRSISEIQKLKYPKRIYSAINNNCKLDNPMSHEGQLVLANLNLKYFIRCLDKHYFFVDTIRGGARYMELYDLKTNQLVVTFHRQILYELDFMADVPDNFTISNNNKLLAYRSGSKIKLYLIECGFEIASIEIKTGETSSIESFMYFFNVVVNNKEEKQGNLLEYKRIYDDLILEHLKRNGDEQDLKTLSQKGDHRQTSEFYKIFEPWLPHGGLQHSVFLDKKKEILLLIGQHTVQVWHDRDDKRTLEFISVIDNIENWNERDNVKRIEYGIKKFKLSIQSENSQLIEMGGDIDVINAVKQACHALKYLYRIYLVPHYTRILVHENLLKFKEIVKQTRNIIVKFIQLYPIVWRLLDFRFDLLSILIEAREYSLIKYILFNEKKSINDVDDHENYILKTLDSIASKFELKKQLSQDIKPDQNSSVHEKSLHMPQYYAWEGGDNTIRKALLDDDPIFLGYFLEYYSNKAVEEIGWMITVGEIIPELYDENNNNYGQLCAFPHLIYVLISQTVFVPITQLVPEESVLEVKEISLDKIPDIRMVPLIDFTTSNELLERRGNKYLNVLKSIFRPSEFVYLDNYYNPFLFLINAVENNYDDPFYYNPSMEAIINFMWYSTESHWPSTLYVYIIYLLSYSIISWMFIAHIQVTGEFQHILVLVTILLFIFLGYASYVGLSQSPTTYDVSNGNDMVYNMTGEEPANLFSNPFSAIIAVYNWDSISLDAWGFWPLIIMGVIGNIVFVMILQNVIISFMSAAFEDADEDGKHATDLDSKLKDKLRVKYICFYNDLSITKAWRENSLKWESIPIYSINEIEKIDEIDDEI